ncbi:hypothetical protein IBX73_00090 [candidate division WOR-3 bacterium]|nr:hypothetical protein [candidate division WOR-3 bacterium]
MARAESEINILCGMLSKLQGRITGVRAVGAIPGAVLPINRQRPVETKGGL